MKQWQKEMINIIMDGRDIHETLARLITTKLYKEDAIYLDNLATEIYLNNQGDAEELKDCLDDEIVEKSTNN